jgi:hypothetical protein
VGGEFRDGGVHRRGGSSGGHGRVRRVTAAREGQGGEKIARNCEDWRLGEKLTGEWRTVAALGRNPSEGGASGGRRGVQRGVGDGGADGVLGAF